MSGVALFSGLVDPRAENVRHRLGDLLVMMVAASLCGAVRATEMALFAAERREALSRLISYDEAPSHDTFSRILRLLPADRLSDALIRLAQQIGLAVAAEGGPAVVALDGKALRRAYECGLAASPPLTVTAFATQTRLCLAAHLPGPEANEVEAALRVVDMLDLKGQVVTADALHCHRRMAEAITARAGDYLLTLKGNRGSWHAEAVATFADQGPPDLQSQQTAHGRHEERSVWVRPAVKPLMTAHRAFVRITTQRGNDDPLTRHFMASRAFTAETALAIARAHWQIENALHWMLDVHLDEDAIRARKDHAPANTATLLRIARNILQTCDIPKVPISHRIKKCAWSNDYLISAISHMR